MTKLDPHTIRRLRDMLTMPPGNADACPDASHLTVLPCPFCGGRPNVGLSGMPPIPSVWCPGHECQGVNMLGRTVEDAVSAWNRRAPREGI